jgi:mannose-6-phosphate isomerase-like protein (cupin superfamily)
MNNLQKLLFKQVAKQKPFFFKKAFSNIFSWTELNQLLNNTPFINYSRFNVIGEEKKPIHEINEWQSDNTVIGPTQLSRYIKNNICFIQDCSRVNEKINKIAESLEYFSKQACDAHIFFSLKDSQEDTDGFGLHKDICNNFIIQVEGTTNFTVKDRFNIVLEPGDCVYVPLGVYHQAKSLEKRLSISFPMNPKHRVFQDRFWIDFLAFHL